MLIRSKHLYGVWDEPPWIEHPASWGGLIDLQLDGDRTSDIDLLAEELLHPRWCKNQIAISADGQRSIPRLCQAITCRLPAQLPRVREDATYLVTGGLGMSGRSVAKWSLSKGAKHLVLTGQTRAPKRHKNYSAQQKSTRRQSIEPADISREEDVSRLMQTISNEFPPLKGVMQSAGVLDDGILALLDWDTFRAPIRAESVREAGHARTHKIARPRLLHC